MVQNPFCKALLLIQGGWHSGGIQCELLFFLILLGRFLMFDGFLV